MNSETTTTKMLIYCSFSKDISLFGNIKATELDGTFEAEKEDLWSLKGKLQFDAVEYLEVASEVA